MQAHRAPPCPGFHCGVFNKFPWETPLVLVYPAAGESSRQGVTTYYAFMLYKYKILLFASDYVPVVLAESSRFWVPRHATGGRFSMHARRVEYSRAESSCAKVKLGI